jgi:hypothetical protein
MERRDYCAYNQTRECFLALEVADSDIQYAKLKDLTQALSLGSSEGLWIIPFRGIPAIGAGIPLDLVYLDRECAVIDVVESFVMLRDVPANKNAASVLALPPHTIYSSQTQPGDQLMICTAGEMVLRFDRLANPPSPTGAVQSAALLRETPLWSGGPGLLELKDRSNTARTECMRKYEMSLTEPQKRSFKPPKNWLEKWWFPDPRRAPREPVNDLAAYYWTGAPPEPHFIRDINSHGLYVVTEERWYPGTLVLMTLQRTDCGEQNIERSIHVYTRAVRWGNDGVGLQFVLPDCADTPPGHRSMVETVNRRALERFLKGLGKEKP